MYSLPSADRSPSAFVASRSCAWIGREAMPSSACPAASEAKAVEVPCEASATASRAPSDGRRASMRSSSGAVGVADCSV